MLDFTHKMFFSLAGMSVGIISLLLLQKKKTKSTSYNEVEWQFKQIRSLMKIAFKLNTELSKHEMKQFGHIFDNWQLDKRFSQIKNRITALNGDYVSNSLSKLVDEFDEHATTLEKSVFGSKQYQKINSPLRRVALIFKHVMDHISSDPTCVLDPHVRQYN